MFALDLEELDGFRDSIWPLSRWLVQFREPDHLKNGEGLLEEEQTADKASRPERNDESESGAHSDDPNTPAKDAIGTRLLRLVTQKTEGKFRPTLSTHRVVILTHLSYYGYNFNPVSFYYIVDKATEELSAVVGEVSNTPWTEMHCYVLHPDSTDRVQTKATHADEVKAVGSATTAKKRPLKKIEYSFPKEFHVSPFMEMDYWYDWTFAGVPGPEVPPGESQITVINTLRRRTNDRIEFTAKLVVDRNPITPTSVVWQMVRLPIFCFIVQVWIHYQAALLFAKGIVYVPHPEGTETAASTAIATIMVPFFAIRDLVCRPPQEAEKSKTA